MTNRKLDLEKFRRDWTYRQVYSRIANELHKARGQHMCTNMEPRDCMASVAQELTDLAFTKAHGIFFHHESDE